VSAPRPSWVELAEALGLVREPLPAGSAASRLVSLGLTAEEAETQLARVESAGYGVIAPRPPRPGFVLAREGEDLVLVCSREGATPQSMAMHELANAMTLVVGMAERALEPHQGGPAERTEVLDRIARTARDGLHVARLVGRSEGDWSERRVATRGEVGSVLARVVDGLRRFAAAREVQLDADLRVGGTVADEHALAAITWNLVKNAIEASPPASVVAVAARTVGETLELSVLDEGTGLEARPKRRRGRGVGLTVVRALVDGLAGTMELGPRPSRGTEARVSLPVRVPEVDACVADDGARAARARVLIVEDDPALRTLMSERLSMLGWQVRATADPWSTLGTSASFDLALVDLHLHGEALSQSFLRTIRERVPRVVAVTGDPVGGADVDRILRKPFELDELVELVEELTGPAAHERAAR
jgi:signal transduction histidine kinase/CheY-like chemotaxis protein